jgi:hypothetical protein
VGTRHDYLHSYIPFALPVDDKRKIEQPNQPAPRPPNRKKQKGACGQNSTAPVGPPWRHLAVDPVPPASWGTRSTRSHLGKRPLRGGPGGTSRSGPGLPGRGWGPSGFGFESVPGGVPIGSTSGARGRPKERRRPEGQKVASKVGTVSSVEATAMPLRCYCGALAPITVLRLNVWQVVLHLRGRSAGAVWGDLTLRRFNDWRALAGARSGALPSCGAHSRQSATPRARIDGKNRCSRRPT